MAKKFSIELVEFYPQFCSEDKLNLEGSIHIYIQKFDMDIRGIQLLGKKGVLHVYLPFRTGIDYDTKELIRYPLIEFTDVESKKHLIEEARELAVEYLKEWERPKDIPKTKKEYQRLLDEIAKDFKGYKEKKAPKRSKGKHKQPKMKKH